MAKKVTPETESIRLYKKSGGADPNRGIETVGGVTKATALKVLLKMGKAQKKARDKRLRSIVHTQ